MKENKLISMVDFVLEQSKALKDNGGYCESLQAFYFHKFNNYANFLKQPLTLGMFVPCDEDGNVLEELLSYDYDRYGMPIYDSHVRLEEYNKAKERVLFEGFEVKDYADKKQIICNGQVVADDGIFRGHIDNIESLITEGYDLILTSQALKQLN